MRRAIEAQEWHESLAAVAAATLRQPPHFQLSDPGEGAWREQATSPVSDQ